MKMAEALDKDLDPCCCAVCLDPLQDPVTIPCGHSFCLSCIGECWDQEQLEACSCPQCRQTFTPRPVLNKNTILAELVEKLKTTQDPPQLPYAGPGDVECDVCTGRKLKAVKFCLVCVASYCDRHLQPHYQSAAFMRHALTKASSKLHENICAQHNRPLEVFCRSDAKCICVLCTMDEHRGHDTVSVVAERAAKQKQFEEIRGRCQRRIVKRSWEMQRMSKAFLDYKAAAQQAEQHCEQALRELLQWAQTTHSELRAAIGDLQVAAESQAEETLEQLEKEMDELSRRSVELDGLSREDDPVQFLQILQRMPTSYETKGFKPPRLSFELIKTTVTEFKGVVEKICPLIEENVSKKVVKATELAGIQFHVGKVKRHLCSSSHQHRFTTDAAVCLTATLEYLIAELLELSGNAAKDDRKGCITPYHIKQAVVSDEEIKKLLQEIYVSKAEPRVAAAKKLLCRKSKRRPISQRNKEKPGHTPKEMVSPSRQQPSSS